MSGAYDPNKYDPVKAHEYYERTKKLKGRNKAAPKSSHPKNTLKSKVTNDGKGQKARARIGRLRSKIKVLQGALSEAEAALSAKRQTARKTAKASSDGKTTVKERQSSKEYRDKHKEELKSKRKTDTKSSSGGKSSTSSSKKASDMSVSELQSRITKIKGALREAKRQLSNATQELGSLAHSAIASEPNVNEHFARFQSAERIPSK